METEFLNKILDIYAENNAQKIRRAYFFAKTAHKGQKRQSGEDYIIHPLGVASILVDLGMDADTIIAALLHDVIEDTQITDSEIAEEFGQEVLLLVQGVTKLSKLNFKTKEEEQAENLRRMFLAMFNDIRVIIIKLADRLNNMRTLAFKDEAAQKRIAKETLEIYAPIAARLGIASIKGELEDLCLRYLYPEDYFYIAEKVAQSKTERQEFVDNITKDIKALLNELGIKGEVNGRPKHFYSIYRKLKRGKTFEQIYDLIAMRIIVDDIKQCYSVLGAVHAKWKPLPGRFKDYISVPKGNLYQSLHTTVIANYGSPFEIQIRTKEMHRIAEYGIAAHWKYKQGMTGSSQTLDDKKLAWIRGVMELQNEAATEKEYLDSVKIDLYADEVFVFTPKGDVFNLPNGSTGIDFAYNVHTEVGNHCVGIKINGKMVPVSTKLENGDVVEVITSNASKGPSRDWLSVVITPSAKSKIKQFFKKELREDNIKIGRDMLEKACHQRGYDMQALLKLPSWKEYIKTKYKLSDNDDVLAMVGYGEFTAQQILSRLLECKAKDIGINVIPENIIAKPSVRPRKKSQDSGILVNGMPGMKVKFSQCCTALPGDEIVGYISKSRGVIIHRKDCPNVAAFEPERLVQVEWPSDTTGRFEVYIDIFADDRTGLIVDIAQAITEMKYPMISLDVKKQDDNTAIAKVCIEIPNADATNHLINKFRSIKGVNEVKRAKGKS
ncbi:MAG: bifunctional (p)ppGpp synthetase/guanosine-3',5'-bis(diphosphate) 3'-pyrophosphohydrolase [Clostridia bacterium]|nr:bifunctional (p)ppGpp synthetase/guanosine-3',5'-bis(diphosphate) 3'-pyrophosphohydrolase [Clostridia bacterium]